MVWFKEAIQCDKNRLFTRKKTAIFICNICYAKLHINININVVFAKSYLSFEHCIIKNFMMPNWSDYMNNIIYYRANIKDPWTGISEKDDTVYRYIKLLLISDYCKS